MAETQADEAAAVGEERQRAFVAHIASPDVHINQGRARLGNYNHSGVRHACVVGGEKQDNQRGTRGDGTRSVVDGDHSCTVSAYRGTWRDPKWQGDEPPSPHEQGLAMRCEQKEVAGDKICLNNGGGDL